MTARDVAEAARVADGDASGTALCRALAHATSGMRAALVCRVPEIARRNLERIARRAGLSARSACDDALLVGDRGGFVLVADRERDLGGEGLDLVLDARAVG